MLGNQEGTIAREPSQNQYTGTDYRAGRDQARAWGRYRRYFGFREGPQVWSLQGTTSQKQESLFSQTHRQP